MSDAQNSSVVWRGTAVSVALLIVFLAGVAMGPGAAAHSAVHHPAAVDGGR